MSINSMMKTYDVYEKQVSETSDPWGTTPVETEVKIGTAEITINYSSANNITNDVRYAEVTHVGLTRDKTLKKDQMLVLGDERYVIHLPPNNFSRMTQLFLKAVVK